MTAAQPSYDRRTNHPRRPAARPQHLGELAEQRLQFALRVQPYLATLEVAPVVGE